MTSEEKFDKIKKLAREIAFEGILVGATTEGEMFTRHMSSMAPSETATAFAGAAVALAMACQNYMQKAQMDEETKIIFQLAVTELSAKLMLHAKQYGTGVDVIVEVDGKRER